MPGAHVAECGPDAVLNGGKVRYELEVGEAVEGGRGIAAQRGGGWIITTVNINRISQKLQKLEQKLNHEKRSYQKKFPPVSEEHAELGLDGPPHELEVAVARVFQQPLHEVSQLQRKIK